ncbi:MAG: cell division protein FtsQ/DivIB [Candidatus Limnocylindrales bacterium]
MAVAMAAAILGVAISPAFDLRQLDVQGARYTPVASVEAVLGMGADAHPNLFSLNTARLRHALLALPAVTGAELRVELPDRLVIRLSERQPILVWAASNQRWLVDVDGVVIGPADPGDPTTAELPVFADDRTGRPSLAPGRSIDATDMAVARRLGALTPAMVGSRAAGLSFEITDADGFTVASLPKGWLAIFGMYTATLRPPDLVPAQVQCLRSLLGQVGERKVATVYLFPEGGQCGTYTSGS